MRTRSRIMIVTAVIMVFIMLAGLKSSGIRDGSDLTINAAGVSGNAAAAGDIIETISKDETVYALLNEDGSVRSIYVVNHVKVPRDGLYVDFGDYEKIESLTEDIRPQVEGDRILWDLKASYGDFFYQGKLRGGELPWTFRIQYYLDGNRIEAGDLAGRSGRVEMELLAIPDESAQPYFRERFAMQIQVPVNLNRMTIVSAEGATQVIAGQTNTLTYTVLPGASASFRIVMDAHGFEMDSINIGISAVDFGNTLSAGIFGQGIEDLSQGLEDWVKGAESFRNGLVELSNGTGKLSSGLHELSSGSTELSKGLEGLAQGMRQLDASLESLSGGSGSIRDGLSEMALSGESILAGYQQLAHGIQADLPGEAEKAQLRMLAQYAAAPDSPYAQAGRLAQSLLDQIAGMEQLYQNLTALNAGLSQYTEGVSKLSEEYKGLDQGVSTLSQASRQLQQGVSGLEEGARQLSGGLSALVTGMDRMNENVKSLPGHAQELLDGGLAIKQGIDTALSGLTGRNGKEEKVLSFASPDKGVAHSVQFVLRTPAVKVPEKEKDSTPETAAKKSFWEKLIALFS